MYFDRSLENQAAISYQNLLQSNCPFLTYILHSPALGYQDLLIDLSLISYLPISTSFVRERRIFLQDFGTERPEFADVGQTPSPFLL